jgi:hypothetical protein
MTIRVSCRLAFVLAAVTAAALSPALLAQNAASNVPTAALVAAPPISFPSDSDSNSPAVWNLVSGRQQLFVMTSVAGQATRHSGISAGRLTTRGDVTFLNPPGHGVWFEAVIADADGTWYGFYHNEWPDYVCEGDTRTIPRIGAARSEDFGATWEDLGVVLEAPPGSHDCGSANVYFVGGVGDFSVALDRDQQYLYIFFSQYASRRFVQGVSVARLTWADRDAPAGKASVWFRNQTWLPTREFIAGDELRLAYPAGTPIYRVKDGWHDGETVDAFWGPSVHWNTYLQQYVMLLNRANDSAWTQEGIYVAFSPTLENPDSWSAPQRLMPGGRWYPQVVGTEFGSGTDKHAGQRARFFAGGQSDFFIQFTKPAP